MVQILTVVTGILCIAGFTFADEPKQAQVEVPIHLDPANQTYKMGGRAQRPGFYSLAGRKITLTQAIITSGGLKAADGDMPVTVVRRVNDAVTHLIVVKSIHALQANSNLDLQLQASDEVLVGIEPPLPAN